ncbi:MAG: hypothetical protein OEL55_04960, partial [Desulfobulbaceae bacterium]|nr:hypothetical protein [Desulfobulbaceae bacterium]
EVPGQQNVGDMGLYQFYVGGGVRIAFWLQEMLDKRRQVGGGHDFPWLIKIEKVKNVATLTETAKIGKEVKDLPLCRAVVNGEMSIRFKW